MPLLYALTLIAGVEFAILHALAEYFSLYWHWPWLDIPMHLYGGALLAGMIATLLQMRVLPYWLDRPMFLSSGVAVVLLLWELFGIYRYGGLKPDFFVDSVLDLVMGVLGFVAGWRLVVLIKKI